MLFRTSGRRSEKAGLPPGSLIHIGQQKTAKVKIQIMDYDDQTLAEKEVPTLDACQGYRESKTMTWINIQGVHDVPVLEQIGECFHLHPLILEDILNTNQRPKLDDLEDYLFVTLKMLTYASEERELKMEQFSLVLGPNYVISLQEMAGDIFEPVRERLRKHKGRIRKMGVDYLAYSLIDVIVDHYFLVLEKLGEEIEDLEEDLVADPSADTIRAIHHLKRELIYLRKSVWPLREIVANLEKSESDLIQAKTKLYLRDIYDHTIEIIDTVETFRDMAAGMLEVYLSSLSHRLNEVMKVLTMIATIFIPLTFIAGVYGMNFKSMPEISWPWGYPMIWGVMIAVGLGMGLYFKRKHWF